MLGLCVVVDDGSCCIRAALCELLFLLLLPLGFGCKPGLRGGGVELLLGGGCFVLGLGGFGFELLDAGPEFGIIRTGECGGDEDCGLAQLMDGLPDLGEVWHAAMAWVSERGHGVFAGCAAGSLGSGCGKRVWNAPDVEGNACVVVYARVMQFCQAIISRGLKDF